VLPKHLNDFSVRKFILYNDVIKQRASSLFDAFTKKMLNLEITDNFRKRRHLISKIYFATRTIENNLPLDLSHKFFKTQHFNLLKLFRLENKRLFRRLSWIQPHNKTKDINIRNIKYFCSTLASNSQKNLKLSRNRHNLSMTLCIILNSILLIITLRPKICWSREKNGSSMSVILIFLRK